MDETTVETPTDPATDTTADPAAKRRTTFRDLALVYGLPPALRLLGTWSRRPVRTIGPWIAMSMAIAIGVLLLVWAIAELVAPDPTRPGGIPFASVGDGTRLIPEILERTAIVLGLHATACLAGFIIFAALRTPTHGPARLDSVTRATARIAIWWIPLATLLSIGTQAWFLGSSAATYSEHLHQSVPTYLLTLAPHLLVELTAVFLPLAAWLLAMRRDRVDTLYAATIASVLIALPMLLGAAWIEATRWEDRVVAAPLDRPHLPGTTLATLVGPDPATQAARIRFGDRIAGARFRSLGPAAERAREESDGRSGAVAIVQLGAGYDLYELTVQKSESGCSSPVYGPATALSVLDFPGHRIATVATTMPSTIVELQVEVIVDGDETRAVEVDPDALESCRSPILRQSPIGQLAT